MKNLSAFWAAAAGVAVGIVLFAVLGAGTIEDSGIFQSLKLGGKTNLISDDGAALTYNGTHYQISSGTLTNASTNAFTGAGLIVLQSAVPANQTNVSAANPTATVATTAVNGSAGTFMRSDASPAIPAAFIQANQTNETTASITNKLGIFSGAAGSYVGGDVALHTVTSEQTNVAAANPSATIGATAVNGSAGTFMRSDAAPAIGSNVITAAMLQENSVADSNLVSGVSGTGPKLNSSGATATNLNLSGTTSGSVLKPSSVSIATANTFASLDIGGGSPSILMEADGDAEIFIGLYHHVSAARDNGWTWDLQNGNEDLKLLRRVANVDNATPVVLFSSLTGNTTLGGSITTGTPNGGTAAAWKLGTVVTGASVTMVTTNYIQVDIGGTLYKLAIVQ